MEYNANIQETAAERREYGGLLWFLLAGLGIGAALSVMLAPRPGAVTRRRIANKCLDGVKIANGKVHQARLRMHKLMDESQRRVTAAVAAGREMFNGVETRASG